MTTLPPDKTKDLKGARLRLIAAAQDIRGAPERGHTRGPLLRQMLMGDVFVVDEVITRDGDQTPVIVSGHADKDGYTGQVDLQPFCPDKNLPNPSHRVIVQRSFVRQAPDLKSEPVSLPLSFGATLAIKSTQDGWSLIESRYATQLHPHGRDLFVPNSHLAPIAHLAQDPVTEAEKLLGTPYVWGGNAAATGIDCSGLVQVACHACGIDCPGDSGPQEHQLGETLPENTPHQRGDLLFWKGHVAWVADPDTLLHANAHHMAVAREPLQEAIQRIQSQGDGPVTRHARLSGSAISSSSFS